MKMKHIVIALVLLGTALQLPGRAAAASPQEVREAVVAEFAKDPLTFSHAFHLALADAATSTTLYVPASLGFHAALFAKRAAGKNLQAAMEEIYDANPDAVQYFQQAAYRLRRTRTAVAAQTLVLREEEEGVFD